MTAKRMPIIKPQPFVENIITLTNGSRQNSVVNLKSSPEASPRLRAVARKLYLASPRRCAKRRCPAGLGACC